MPLFFNEPQRFTPCSNPCIFVFGEEIGVPGSKPNKSFKVTFIVNGAEHSTHQIFPENEYETRYYGRFDAKAIVKNLVSSPIIANDNLIQAYNSAWISFKIKVQEMYGTPPTPQGLEVESSEIIGFNGAMRIPDWLQFRHEQYLPDNENGYTPPADNQRFFLTSFPRGCKEYVGMNEKKFLATLFESTSMQFQVNLFDITDTPIPGTSHNVNFANPEKVNILNVSPQNIIDNTPIVEADFDNCYYYQIRFNDNGPQGSYQGGTEFYRLYIDRDCRTFKRYRLHWLNKFGVWDAFTFRMESEETTEVNRETFESSLGQWYDIPRTNPADPTTASSDFYVSVEDGQEKTYATYSNDSVTVNTDFIKPEVQNWLVKSLYESPTVFMETELGFEQVILTSKSFKIKKRKRDGLIQESLKFRRTFRYNSQNQ